MSGVSRSELAHRHHSDGAGTFFSQQSEYLYSVTLLGFSWLLGVQ